jgi:hypothetical protein
LSETDYYTASKLASCVAANKCLSDPINQSINVTPVAMKLKKTQQYPWQQPCTTKVQAANAANPTTCVIMPRLTTIPTAEQGSQGKHSKSRYQQLAWQQSCSRAGPLDAMAA